MNQESERELTELATLTESGAILLLLSLNLSSHVRTAVAGNVRTPPLVLSALSADEDTRVRAAVARHSLTPLSALQRFITNPLENVTVKALALTNDYRFIERLSSMDAPTLHAYLTHSDSSFVEAAENELRKRSADQSPYSPELHSHGS